MINDGIVSIGVYPEGTRSKDCRLLPFHNGVFLIAEKTKAPVVVMALRGTEQIHKRCVFRRTHVYLDVLDVITPGELEEITETQGWCDVCKGWEEEDVR